MQMSLRFRSLLCHKTITTIITSTIKKKTSSTLTTLCKCDENRLRCAHIVCFQYKKNFKSRAPPSYAKKVFTYSPLAKFTLMNASRRFFLPSLDAVVLTERNLATNCFFLLGVRNSPREITFY